MIVGSPVTPWNEFPLPGVFEAPRAFVDERNEYRLIPALRQAAQTRDPTEILARAAERYFFTVQGEGPAVALGNAFADLAATGRASYLALNGLDMTTPDGPDVRALKDATRLRLAAYAPTDAEVAAAVNQALDRAYAVAWALRGPVATRAALRAALGWIAVSAEDDTPHRPVNMPAPPYEQYEIQVTAGALSLWTRFFIASAEEASAAATPPEPRALPEDPEPRIPVDSKVLLFLHGHSSGAEEALDIIPHLLEQGLARGTRYSVISLDLPNNGYSETFDHTLVAPASATTFPRLPTDNGPIATPILDFIEDFVVAFVDKLGKTIKDRLVAVIGGSLGGNLALRLGRRDLMNSPWLDRAIVSWSPASVWQPMVQHATRRLGPEHCMAEYVKAETNLSRQDYFHQVYEKAELPGVLKQQTAYWYRKKWELTELHILLSRMARREIYNANYRQWHWRVAGEQLIYSHFDREVHGDNTTRIRYEKNTVRTLLVAAEEDNYSFTGIYDATKTMGNAMVNTPGRLLLVRDTGHSIHLERPRYFASEIVKFLNERSMQIDCVIRKDGRIQSVGGLNDADNARFTLTQEQCIVAIHRGDDFYVDTDGDRAQVIIGFISDPNGVAARYFLKTEADGAEPNNLLSLEECTGP